MTAGLALLVVLSLVLTLGLYLAVRAEHDRRERMDRSQAERTARRDTRDRE